MFEWETRGGGSRGEGCALDRERAKTAHWSDPGVVRMEIRPDRFKVVAAKTLGKIYGYVKYLWDKLQPENVKKGRLPCHVLVFVFFFKRFQLLQLNWASGGQFRCWNKILKWAFVLKERLFWRSRCPEAWISVGDLAQHLSLNRLLNLSLKKADKKCFFLTTQTL